MCTCWLMSEEICKNKCKKKNGWKYCYFSLCHKPQVRNAEVSVILDETRGETFDIKCKDGYALPNGVSWDSINCNKRGYLERNTFDCFPRNGDIIPKVGSTNFKCKADVRIAEVPSVYVSNYIRWTKTCFDECYDDSNCR